MLYPHCVIVFVFLDDGYASKSSSSTISNHALSDECGRHVIKVRFFMRFLQISPLPFAMPLSIRDLSLPPDEAPSIVKFSQIELYLSLIPATILVYDTRASLLQNMLFSPLTLCQSVLWTKRYDIKCSPNDSMMTIPD